MTTLKRITLFALALFTFSACGDSDDEAPNIPGVSFSELKMNITGLPNLGDRHTYEAWLIVDNVTFSIGTFDVFMDGSLSKNTFFIDEYDLENATTFVVTIEPVPDNESEPSDTRILAGDFGETEATLRILHEIAIGDDFFTSTGGYVLGTPTDDDDTNENSGVWWMNPATGPGPGLTLPVLNDGWTYEGWVVLNGTPISTGTFTDPAMADNSSMFSGIIDGPNFPGEDFLQNPLPPPTFTFPTDLAGAMTVISVEPVPDNSPQPFILKPLVGQIPADATNGVFYEMTNNAITNNPTGSATR